MRIYALENIHAMCIARSNLCFGKTYHNNLQPDLAHEYYMKAWEQYKTVEVGGQMFDAGFNIARGYLNTKKYDKLLDFCDTIMIYSNQWEVARNLIHYPNHIKIR